MIENPALPILTGAKLRFAENLSRITSMLELVGAALRSELPQLPDDGLVEYVNSFQSALSFLDEWHVVMVVTFVESYSEDVLADAAGEDPSLMAKSEQTVSYADAVAAESLVALRTEIRHRWSRNFVNDGGPWRLRMREQQGTTPARRLEGSHFYPFDPSLLDDPMIRSYCRLDSRRCNAARLNACHTNRLL
jgi:hypothetical protein